MIENLRPHRFLGSLLLSLSALFVGCGDPPAPAPIGVSDPLFARDELIRYLDEIAETGVVGSASEEIGTRIQTLKESDPTLAGELETQLAELKQAASPEKVKEIAKAMAAKL